MFPLSLGGATFCSAFSSNVKASRLRMIVEEASFRAPLSDAPGQNLARDLRPGGIRNPPRVARHPEDHSLARTNTVEPHPGRERHPLSRVAGAVRRCRRATRWNLEPAADRGSESARCGAEADTDGTPVRARVHARDADPSPRKVPRTLADAVATRRGITARASNTRTPRGIGAHRRTSRRVVARRGVDSGRPVTPTRRPPATRRVTGTATAAPSRSTSIPPRARPRHPGSCGRR